MLDLPKNFYKEIEKKNVLKHILYGDSVSKDTETVIKYKNNIYNISFNNIWDTLITLNFQVTLQNNKEYIYFNNEIETLSYDIKTDSIIFKPLKYIMRHYHNKNLIRIFTSNCCYLDMTEDHSLLDYNIINNSLDPIKPKDATYITTLSNTNTFIDDIKNIDILYFLLGLYYGNGSFTGFYPEFSLENRDDILNFIKTYIPDLTIYLKKKKCDFSLNYKPLTTLLQQEKLDNIKNIDLSLTPNLINIFNKDTNKFISFILGNWLVNGSYNIKLITFNSGCREYIDQLKNLFINIGISSNIIKDTNERSYDGIINGDIYKLKIPACNLSIINNLNDLIKFKINKNDIILEHGTFYGKGTSKINKNITRKLENAIIKNIRPIGISNKQYIEYDNYVYDFEVEDTHNFIANGYLVHNTDSLFIMIPLKEEMDDINKKWKQINDVGDIINNLIIDYYNNILLKRQNIDPKYNKMYFKSEMMMESIMFLDVKKSYAYKLIMKEGNIVDPAKVGYKGIQVVRSNTPELTRKLLIDLIENIMLNTDIPIKEKNEYISHSIKKHHAIFIENITNFNFEELSVPCKWSKRDNVISGMTIYNGIMGKEVFTPGSAGKMLACKFQNPNIFKEFNIEKPIDFICIPFKYNKEELKEVIIKNKIVISMNDQWDKIYTTVVQRVVNLAKRMNTRI